MVDNFLKLKCSMPCRLLEAETLLKWATNGQNLSHLKEVLFALEASKVKFDCACNDLSCLLWDNDDGECDCLNSLMPTRMMCEKLVLYGIQSGRRHSDDRSYTRSLHQ